MLTFGASLEELRPYISHVIDTALSADHSVADVDDRAVLVGWQCGFEPLIVAVIGATCDTRGRRDRPDEEESIEIARDYLRECQWFSDPEADNDPDFVLNG